MPEFLANAWCSPVPAGDTSIPGFALGAICRKLERGGSPSTAIAAPLAFLLVTVVLATTVHGRAGPLVPLRNRHNADLNIIMGGH